MKKIIITTALCFGFLATNAQLAGNWSLSGNSVTSASFLGTTNDQDLVFKRNNVEIARFNSNNITIGYGTPSYIAGTSNIAIGQGVLNNATQTQFNTVIGSLSAFNTTSSYNTILGTANYEDLTTGATNIAVGVGNGQGLVTGYGNVIIGNGVSSFSSDMSEHIILATGWGNIRMTIKDTGKVLIGNPANTTTPGNYMLYVEQGILTEKVKVALKSTGDWADYVFEEDYELMPLNEVEDFINENKHLPGISSAETLVEEGIDLGAMQAKLLEKIEELTLYLIQKDKEIEELRQQVKLLAEKE